MARRQLCFLLLFVDAKSVLLCNMVFVIGPSRTEPQFSQTEIKNRFSRSYSLRVLEPM